jgi:hypothetical protein
MKVKAKDVLKKAQEQPVEQPAEAPAGVDPRVQALASFLSISPEDVVGSGNNQFEADGGGYLVLLDDESTRATEEHILSLIDEMGIGVFNPEFAMSYIDTDKVEEYFRQVYDEWNYSYADDIASESASGEFENRLEEEMAERGVSSRDDFVAQMTQDQIDEGRGGLDHFRSSMGDEEADRLIVEEGLVDIDKLIDAAIGLDGRGHFLASYDMDESAMKVNGETYFIYRTN